MKDILANTKARISHRLGQVSIRLYHARASASRGLSMLMIVLILLLLLDIGFVVLQTSMPVDAIAAGSLSLAPMASIAKVPTTATAAPAMTSTGLVHPIGNGKLSRPRAPLPTAVAIPTPTTTASSETADVTANAQQSQPAAIEATPVICDNPVGQLLTDTMQSKVLGQSLPVNIYLPPCYDATKFSYPSLYLIQGSGYEMGEWVADGVTRIADIQMSLGILPPFIIVMPASDLRSGNGSRYLYSTGGKGSWEDFMVNELIPMVDGKYSTWKVRDGRAIGGISRGGYWSLQIGFTHPDMFGAVGGHSPSITPDKLIGTPANFSMLSLAKSISDVNTLRIFLDAGDSDWAQSGVDRLSSDLDTKHISYTSSSGDGGHEDTYWASRIDDYLAFYSADWPRVARTRADSIGLALDTARTQP